MVPSFSLLCVKAIVNPQVKTEYCKRLFIGLLFGNRGKLTFQSEVLVNVLPDFAEINRRLHIY